MIKASQVSPFRTWLVRILMVGPPLLFIGYVTHGLVQIRALMGESKAFHMDYANDLVQDYLALDLALELGQLYNHLAFGESLPELPLISTQEDGEPIRVLRLPDGSEHPVYLKRQNLAQILPDFFDANRGLSSLYTTRYHEPVYWFQILDDKGERVYVSGQKPDIDIPSRTYDMERSLVGYTIEILYNSFGARQLYSVARTKVNFGFVLLLFVLAVFSGILLTYTIRQKLILARQKTFFVSTVSHEFKTPLAIMKLAAETLGAKRFRKPEDEDRFRGMLVSEINRLDYLVHKILSFNRIEMGQLQYTPREMDLAESIKPSLEIFTERAKADGVTIEVTMDEGPLIIYGDGHLIRHAIDNIIDNALKYRGESTRIEFSCIRRDRQIQITVRDHGIGIPADELPHIQKSFYRAQAPSMEGIRGSGLGLSISRYILKRAGAELEIESEEGKGSSFTISFPSSLDT